MPDRRRRQGQDVNERSLRSNGSFVWCWYPSTSWEMETSTKNWMPVYPKIEYRIVWSHDCTLLAIVVCLIFVVCSWLTSATRLGYPKSLYVDVFLASIECNNDQQQTLTSIIQRLPQTQPLYYFLSSLSIQFAAAPVALVKTHLSQSSP